MRDVGDSISTASSINQRLAEAASKEFFWGCELSKDKPAVHWNFEEEEDDQDFLEHTLFLRHAILGKGITKDERNVVEIETKNFAGDEIKQPIISLTGGQLDMCNLDLNFGHEIPVTFRLVEGSGPVFLSAQQLVEFPQEVEEDDFLTATDTETECTDEEDLEEVEDLKGKKRKANGAPGSKKKKGKLDADISNGTDEDEDEDDDDEDEDEDEEDDEEEEMETSDEAEEDDDEDDDEDEEEEDESPKKKNSKGKKGRQSAGSAKNIKKNKPKPKAKKPAKKGKSK